MPRTECDVVVLGVGGMGSAATYHLARRGIDVVGLERYDVPHSRGSSHGLTRIIRFPNTRTPHTSPWFDGRSISGRTWRTATTDNCCTASAAST